MRHLLDSVVEGVSYAVVICLFDYPCDVLQESQHRLLVRVVDGRNFVLLAAVSVLDNVLLHI